MPATPKHLSASTQLLNSIHAATQGLSMAELLTLHPSIARRSAQRHVANLVASGQVMNLQGQTLISDLPYRKQQDSKACGTIE